MQENELKIFINSTMGYFENFSPEKPEIGVPYPKKSDALLLEYTGAIGISGARKGCIYITATTDFLSELIQLMPGAPKADEAARLDMIGELANTVSGNAQNAFGAEFVISVPMVVTGTAANIHLPLELPTFVIPFTWKGHRSFLVVGLK